MNKPAILAAMVAALIGLLVYRAEKEYARLQPVTYTMSIGGQVVSRITSHSPPNSYFGETNWLTIMTNQQNLWIPLL